MPSNDPSKKKMHPAMVVLIALASVMGVVVVLALALLGLVAYTCSK